jgi:hypothetical protein
MRVTSVSIQSDVAGVRCSNQLSDNCGGWEESLCELY